MIKAEITANEDTSSPTLLDRARSLVTPTRASLTILLLAVIGIIIAVTQQANAPKLITSQQTANVTNVLQVLPQPTSAASASSATDIQAASGGSLPSPSIASSSSLGPAVTAGTAGLNTSAGSAGAASTQAPASLDQTQLNGRSLTTTP